MPNYLLAAKVGKFTKVQEVIEEFKDGISEPEAAAAAASAAIDAEKELKVFLNKTGEFQNTALHLAAEAGHEEVVKYLVEQGAEVKIENYFLDTPLFSAARKGHLPVVRYLVETGIADIEAVDEENSRPLNFAIGSRLIGLGRLDMVKYLVKQRAIVMLLVLMTRILMTWRR